MTVNFLNKQTQVQLPEGGTFTPSGMVAPWMAAIMYQFYTQEDLLPEFKNQSSTIQRGSNGYWHYFSNQAVAIDAYKAMNLDTRYSPSVVWRFEAETASVLNFDDEVKGKFGNLLAWDVNVKTYGSPKRHEFHMIALPAAVNAMAMQLGYETSGFDLSELIGTQTTWTQDFSDSMIGDPNAKEGDEKHYTNSVLWLRRAQLWSELGEENSKAYQMIGSGGKFETTSQKLSECLGIANFPWSTKPYAKIVTVDDPRFDAVLDGNKRLSIPALFEIYDNQAAAQAAVDTLASTSSNTTVPATTSTPTTVSSATLPALPAQWVSAPDDWMKYASEFKASLDNKALIPPNVTKAISALAVTEEEIRAWWDYIV